MFGLENVVCCPRDNYEEEEHYYLPNSLATGMVRASPSCPMAHLDDNESAWGPIFFGVQPYFPTLKAPALQTVYARDTPCTHSPPLNQWYDAPPRRKLSVLKDWAIALFAYHAKGVVHGNLTSKSVDVVRGTGVMLDQRPPLVRQWAEPPLDEDLSGVRWAASELFRIDNVNPHPTTMSDVYSFGCLMLQLLTGSVPYCGTKRPEQVVYLKYLGREPIDPQTPRVADHHVAFMRWCWSSEPRNRPTMDTVVGFVHDEIERLKDQHE